LTCWQLHLPKRVAALLEFHLESSPFSRLENLEEQSRGAGA
jgi:hypothetical protein